MPSLTVIYIVLLLCATGSIGFEPGNADAISIRPQQLNHVAGIGGTTSVHWFSKDSSLLIGTKKGGINHVDIDRVKNDELAVETQREKDCDMGRRTEVISNQYQTKYPIYSMTTMPPTPTVDNTFLFCGSGDRWISVWKLGTANPIPNFEFFQKLGPHTGWVKDLVYDDESQLLHSIGCNCIETWDCASLSADLDISHITKRAIENSPTMGTTLSSDLLCLCLLPTRSEGPRLLVSGGVDGRIHLWVSDPRTTQTHEALHTTLAHDGRVNAIVYSSSTNTIFTAGNDGLLCVFCASIEGFKLVSRLKIGQDSSKETSRITVASIVSLCEEQGTCSLALGSSAGELYFVTAEANTNGGIDCHVEGESTTIAEKSMIYSIACDKGSSAEASSRLWVGHASGLATVDRYHS